MAELISKIFDEIKDSLKKEDYERVELLLNNLDGINLPYAANKLYTNFVSKSKPKETSYKNIPIIKNGLLSTHDRKETIPGISIVSCCMNRNENLVKACETWLKLNVDEIIIVDWNSTVPVSISLKNLLDDNRIKILRVENEDKWILTYGFNIGLRFSSYETVYKIDADIEVSKDFLSLNKFDKNHFIRGSWKEALKYKKDNQIYVNGSFGCHKKHLLEVGFYNEFIRTYGWDDSDLYERLSVDCGLGQKYLHLNSILHMEQKPEDRIINQDVLNSLFLDKIEPTEFNNQKNKCLVRLQDYWDKNLLQDYQVSHSKNNTWSLKRVTKDIEIENYIIADSNIYSSLLWLKNNKNSWFSQVTDTKLLAKVFYTEYKKNIPCIVTAKTLALENNNLHIFSHPISYLLEYINNISNKENYCNEVQIVFILSEQHLYEKFEINNCKIIVRSECMRSFSEILELRNNILKNKNKEILNIDLLQIKSTSNKEIVNKLNSTSLLNKKKLYIDAQHGLGNRLRAIASAANIANKTERELVVVWEPDHHCECGFLDLFDYEGLVIENSFLEKAKENNWDIYNYMEAELDSDKDKELAIGTNNIYVRSAYALNSSLTDWEGENNFIKKLKPVKKVAEIVNSFDVSGAIAVHVRMEAGKGLDDNTYDSVENWTQEGHNSLHFWREKSHYSHFIKRIDELVAKNPTKKIFLATDMPETYKIFQRYYGNKLVFLKRNIYDRSKEQIIYGLIDAILLSRCESMLGSTWSSFSELAIRLSETFYSIEMSGRDF
jgi:hypothetical protein